MVNPSLLKTQIVSKHTIDDQAKRFLKWNGDIRNCGIYLRAISEEMFKISILDMSLKITYSK